MLFVNIDRQVVDPEVRSSRNTILPTKHYDSGGLETLKAGSQPADIFGGIKMIVTCYAYQLKMILKFLGGWG